MLGNTIFLLYMELFHGRQPILRHRRMRLPYMGKCPINLNLSIFLTSKSSWMLWCLNWNHFNELMASVCWLRSLFSYLTEKYLLIFCKNWRLEYLPLVWEILWVLHSFHCLTPFNKDNISDTSGRHPWFSIWTYARTFNFVKLTKQDSTKTYHWWLVFRGCTQYGVFYRILYQCYYQQQIYGLQ